MTVQKCNHVSNVTSYHKCKKLLTLCMNLFLINAEYQQQSLLVFFCADFDLGENVQNWVCSKLLDAGYRNNRAR